MKYYCLKTEDCRVKINVSFNKYYNKPSYADTKIINTFQE